MFTIGRKWPTDTPAGDYQATCSYCGVMWLRSKLRRDRSGNYVCPDEGAGLDANALSEIERNALVYSQKRRFRADGLYQINGLPDEDGNETDDFSDHPTGREDI